MCYKYATPKLKDLLAHLEGMSPYEIEDYFEYYLADGFVTQFMPITTTENNRKIEKAIWGLVPDWILDSKEAKEWSIMTLNAKSETVFEKASFKKYIGSQRCLIWASGFFEHRWDDAKGKSKTPFFIYMPNYEPFTMGGVYSEWVRPDTGEILKTFSIITTEANQLLSEIHNNKKRMPLIITADKREAWLSDLNNEQIKELMQPLPDNILQAHTISKLITSRQDNPNQPAVQEQYDYNKTGLF